MESSMMQSGSPVCVAIAAFVLMASFHQPVRAQAPTCMTLLAEAELTKAVGAKMDDAGAETRGEGETACGWMLRGGSKGFQSVSVQFYDLGSIKGRDAAPTLDAAFEQEVEAGESAGSAKREMLSGIGQKAAFVPTAPQMFIIVQRADGIARIVANNLTKEQITAVARAVAEP
jgi:hypothetical protein